jgi:hypothetical protein
VIPFAIPQAISSKKVGSVILALILLLYEHIMIVAINRMRIPPHWDRLIVSLKKQTICDILIAY